MRSKNIFSAAILLALVITSPLQAESIIAQGVAGDMDSHSRSPVLTVSTETATDNVKILADAYVQSPEFAKYPLRFDFFINRKLFTSQIRSPELPGAVGVDIGPDIAVPPFNYAVVVEMIHPNRTFTSVVQGAVYENNLTKAYACTASLITEDNQVLTFSDTSVEALQTAGNVFSMTFNGASSTNDTLDLTSTITLATDNKALYSELNLTYNGETTNLTGAGSAETDANRISAFELTSSDGTLTLRCS